MRYGSVCSGIEAATAAWHHMGWEAAFFSEIEAFPCAVLQHHYPEVPLHGDFTTIERNQYGQIDLLVGGTPCQSFSVAGLRGGLDDERGNLALEFCRLAQRERPRWIVWENVPGVLSSNGGRDFGSILGALEDLGYGLAYRVLDAQYFGVAQRRRRVFVVGYLGDWRPAAAVLFERHSMSGHPAPSREARKEAARAALSGAEERGGCGGDGSSIVGERLIFQDSEFGVGEYDTAGSLRASRIPEHQMVLEKQWPADVACTLDTDFASKWGQNNQHVNAGCPLFVPDSVAYAIMPMNSGKDYKARETEVAQPIMAAGPVGGNQGGDYIVTPFDTTQITSPHNYSSPKAGDPCHPLAAGAHSPAIAIGFDAYNNDVMGDVSKTIDTGQDYHHVPNVFSFSAKDHGGDATEELSPTLRAGGFTNSHQNGGVMPAVAAFQSSQSGVRLADTHATLDANNGPRRHNGALVGSAVRRLTPVECERLQGFPDNFTAIPWKKKGPEQCPDGPRYKALGNSMAVPVMRWIGERIQLVDDLISVL